MNLSSVYTPNPDTPGFGTKFWVSALKHSSIQPLSYFMKHSPPVHVFMALSLFSVPKNFCSDASPACPHNIITTTMNYYCFAGSYGPHVSARCVCVRTTPMQDAWKMKLALVQCLFFWVSELPDVRRDERKCLPAAPIPTPLTLLLLLSLIIICYGERSFKALGPYLANEGL
jgi:hypothetical protein